jgi:hypothetical protein
LGSGGKSRNPAAKRNLPALRISDVAGNYRVDHEAGNFSTERISDGTAAPAAAIHEGRSRRLTIRVLFWVFFGGAK